MGDFMGKDEEDYRFDEFLPEAYVKYVSNMLDDSVFKVFHQPKNNDRWFDVQVRTSKNDLLYGLQGVEGDQTAHLYYSRKNFLFHMIPLSINQQIMFTKLLFDERLRKRLYEETGINLGDSFFKTSPMFNKH